MLSSKGFARIMCIEFFGIPRQRAGVPKLEAHADTLGQLLGTLVAQMPPLGEFITIDRLHSAFLANLNGDRFISDPATPLVDDDCVIILSADAGG
jgi:molybdopterin converting factor small subunit